jgi:hypothetical protein
MNTINMYGRRGYLSSANRRDIVLIVLSAGYRFDTIVIESVLFTGLIDQSDLAVTFHVIFDDMHCIYTALIAETAIRVDRISPQRENVVVITDTNIPSGLNSLADCIKTLTTPPKSRKTHKN